MKIIILLLLLLLCGQSQPEPKRYLSQSLKQCHDYGWVNIDSCNIAQLIGCIQARSSDLRTSPYIVIIHVYPLLPCFRLGSYLSIDQCGDDGY